MSLSRNLVEMGDGEEPVGLNNLAHACLEAPTKIANGYPRPKLLGYVTFIYETTQEHAGKSADSIRRQMRVAIC